MDTRFDTIVAGAGSAGCVVGSRLSEGPRRHVLLLGSERARPSSTAPQAEASGRVVPLVTGIEDHELGAGTTHGAGGPMVITGPRHLRPLALPLLRAGMERGWSPSDDLSGDRRSGIARGYSNIRDGRRHGVAQGCLDAAAGRPDLTVRTGTRAVGPVLHQGRAVGVGVRDENGTESGPEVRRGVVLTAGALRSPQLLMLSGIGPGSHLREKGVAIAERAARLVLEDSAVG